MSKKLQLQIPTPCHENWDHMSPVEKGRFCSSCQKQVVDFSRMSDREIAMFFKKPSTGSVCGRFMEDQLNRYIEIPKKRIPWLKYFFQFLLPGFLLSCTRPTIGKIKVAESTKVESERTIGEPVASDPLSEQSTTMVGDTTIVAREVFYKPKSILHDERQINSDKGKQKKVLPISELKSPVTKATFKESEVKNPSGKGSPFFPTLNGRVGGVVIRVGGVGVRRCSVKNNSSKPIQIIQEIIKGAYSNDLKVYPNPIVKGQSINIEFISQQSTNAAIRLLASDGKTMFQKEVIIENGPQHLTLSTDSKWAAGSYFMQLIFGQGKLVLQKQIIIQ